MTGFDVYSFGVVSPSTLIRFDGDFPQPDGYAEFDDVRYMVGGEAANSSMVLARLGARVKLDGNWMANDDRGRHTRQILDQSGIDTSRLTLKNNYAGVGEMVFAADTTRTIFGNYGRLLEREDWNTPVDEDIHKASVICLDPFFKEASLRAARAGAGAGLPVITVDCLHNDPILHSVSAVVVSHNYLQWKYPGRDPTELMRAYMGATNGLVIFTFGDQPAWYGRPGEEVHEKPVFRVDAIDTSAAGDSFRAGIAFGFLRGWNDSKVVEFASAVAAINCTRFPGAMNSPSYEEATDFIRRHK